LKTEQLSKIALAWSWFFLVLLSYYCLKPLRDSLGTSLAEHFDKLYLGTFIGTIITMPIYSKLISVVPRRVFVVVANQVFVICIFAFTLLLNSQYQSHVAVVSAFFVWTSIFNVFSVAMFWSVMVEQFAPDESKTWFGIIAAGGSVGSTVGSLIASQLSRYFGSASLLVAAIIAIELSVIVAMFSMRRVETTATNTSLPVKTSDQEAIGGSMFDGFIRVITSPYLAAICLFVICGKFTSTFIYNNLQLSMKSQIVDAAQRTIIFSDASVYSQAGSLFVQACIVGFVLKRFGVTTALLIPCVLVTGWFVWLSRDASLNTLLVGQIGQQISAYGLISPAQNVLFTVVSKEDKYKSKAFTDTVVFRGSDVLSSSLTKQLSNSRLDLQSLAVVLMPVTVLWCWYAIVTGRMYQKKLSA
jgi:ATP:ADP antiporter, AAA family